MPAKDPRAISELKIGPFSGGINTYSDPSAIADTELIDCVNFDISLDGSLRSRPPWNTEYQSERATYSTGTYTEISTRVLGSFIWQGNRFIVISSGAKEISSSTYTSEVLIQWLDGPSAGTSTVMITTSDTYLNPFTDIIRYKDVLYMVRPHGATCGKYDLATAAYTSIGSMPAASTGVIYKDRLWLVGDIQNNKSRLYFSDVADPTSWPSGNFFDIRPGDGDTLNDLIIYQDNMFLFKNNSVWVFSYATQPTNAILQQLNEGLGVDNSYSMAFYENTIYFLKYNQVYQISNYDFTRISTKIPFDDDRTLPVPVAGENYANTTWQWATWLSLAGDRLVIRFYNRLYVYHLRKRAWSRWDSQDLCVKYMGQIVHVANAGLGDGRSTYETYVSGCSLAIIPIKGVLAARNVVVNKMVDIVKYDNTSTEGSINYSSGTYSTVAVNILLSIKTKIYDIGISHRFKRLLHWGCDIVTGKDVTGTLFPYSLAYRVTWAQLHLHTWNQLQTWGYPLFAQPSTTQSQPVNAGVYRRFIRFPKSLRFRLLQFSVTLQTAGNTSDGPAQLYSLTAFVGQKQLVGKAVN